MAVEARTVTVTPALAQAWLDKTNSRNRKINTRRVTQYARHMAEGEWVLNGETIVFAADGMLIDGQHRLYACVKADVPFDTIVIGGIEDGFAAQDTSDAGGARRTGQQLTLRGEKYGKDLASTLRFRHILEGLIGTGNQSVVGYTTVDALRDLGRMPDIRDSVYLCGPLAAGLSRYRVRVGAACHYTFVHLDSDTARDDADEFFKLYHDMDLANPRRTAPASHPVTQLRAQVLKVQSDQKATLDAVWLAAVTIKAWNAWRDGIEIHNLRWRRGGSAPERFPVPR